MMTNRYWLLLPVFLLGCEINMGGSGAGQGAVAPTAAPANPPPQAQPTPTEPATQVNALRRSTPTTPPPRVVGAVALYTPPTVQGSNDFGNGTPREGAFKGNVYYIPETSTQLPDLTPLQPIATLYTDVFDISPRKFDKGFPGVNDRFEWFAIRYEANLVVAQEAEYAFRLVSDDGAVLSIDNVVVINNDGVHPVKTQTGKARLTAGAHPVRLDYFQGPRFEIALQLYVTPPNQSEKLLGTRL